MLGHKKSLNKLNIEIIQSIFSDNSGIKLEITSGKLEKISIIWKLNNRLLTNRSKEKSHGRLENILRQ